MCWGDQRSDLHRLGSVGVAVTMVPSIIGCASDFWLSTEASDQHLGLWKLSDHSQSLEGETHEARCYSALKIKTLVVFGKDNLQTTRLGCSTGDDILLLLLLLLFRCCRWYSRTGVSGPVFALYICPDRPVL